MKERGCVIDYDIPGIDYKCMKYKSKLPFFSSPDQYGIC